MERGIPFEIKMPNNEIVQAIKDAREGKIWLRFHQMTSKRELSIKQKRVAETRFSSVKQLKREKWVV